MVHYKRNLERLVALDEAIQRIREEKQRIYAVLSNPPASALDLFNDEDRITIEQTIAAFFHGDRNAYFLQEVNEMIEREELRAAHAVQKERIGLAADEGPFLPSYLGPYLGR